LREIKILVIEKDNSKDNEQVSKIPPKNIKLVLIDITNKTHSVKYRIKSFQ